MPPCAQPFNLTQIETAKLPSNIENWTLAESSLARALRDALQDLVATNTLPPRVAKMMMHRLMAATIKAFHEHVFEADGEQGVRTKGKIVNYRNYDGLWTLWLKDVWLELQAGEPNPMGGYVPSPKKTDNKGKGTAENPYDLTGKNEYAADSESQERETQLVSQTAQAMVFTASPATKTSIAPGSKRTHSKMLAGSTFASTSILAKYPSNAMEIWATPGKKGSYTILIPRLTIRMLPSGYLQHYSGTPQDSRTTLTHKFQEWEGKRMIDKGVRKERVSRGPNKPRKKKKTEEKVEAEDLAEDEPENGPA